MGPLRLLAVSNANAALIMRRVWGFILLSCGWNLLMGSGSMASALCLLPLHSLYILRGNPLDCCHCWNCLKVVCWCMWEREREGVCVRMCAEIVLVHFGKTYRLGYTSGWRAFVCSVERERGVSLVNDASWQEFLSVRYWHEQLQRNGQKKTPPQNVSTVTFQFNGILS